MKKELEYLYNYSKSCSSLVLRKMRILDNKNYHLFDEKVHNVFETSNLIVRKIDENQPFVFTRFGTVEHRCFREFTEINLGIRRKFSDKIVHDMSNNAGFFSNDYEGLLKYCEMIKNYCSEIDALGVFNMHMENYTIKNYCGDVYLGELRALDPVVSNWSAALKGKKILIISPLVNTIEYQYKNKRQYIFDDDSKLPIFENMQIVRAIQTIAGNKDDRFDNWFEALEYMKKEVSKCDFDIALISAGAYGLPLAIHIKNMSKIAIHVGGSLQLLFGIKGKRWDDIPGYSKLYNEHWTRTFLDDMPQNTDKVEGGAYW